jgi:hypothetical protein
MESPFYPSSSSGASFTLYLEPILDSYSQTYRQVITLSCMPPGPLASMVKMMSLPKLSPFATNNHSFMGTGCSYILFRYPVTGSGSASGNIITKKGAEYMYSDDIPAVFSYLTNHGYTIDKGVTKMMNGSRVLVGSGASGGSGSASGSDSNRRLICFASFF